ncbi:MAG: histidine phosphatase family protein [Candidatus Thorarchaeota archaeon]|nr:histidine phosphatase family protein [Candidatus Thorarchaeota archaeon]
MPHVKSWYSVEWLNSARNIAEWTKETPAGVRTVLLLRHSHRERLNNHEEMMGAGLTDLGRKTAYEMGCRLRVGSNVHISTSFISRCYETAEHLAEGLAEQGYTMDSIDTLPALVGPENAMDVISRELHPDGENVTEFINNWSHGRYDGEMESFRGYLNRLDTTVFNDLETLEAGGTSINITHDLTLMTAKRAILGEPLSRSNREPYLGGIAVRTRDSGIEILFGRKKQVLNRQKNELFIL